MAGVLIAWLLLDGLVFLDVVQLGPEPMQSIRVINATPAERMDAGILVWLYEHTMPALPLLAGVGYVIVGLLTDGWRRVRALGRVDLQPSA